MPLHDFIRVNSPFVFRFTSSTKMAKSPIPLYKDQFVEVYPDHLLLKTYYFPTGADKRVPLERIQHVFYRRQACVNDFFVAKDWGMTVTPVWWALDWQRHLKHLHFNVVVDTGHWVRKGFSVVDVNAFLNALQPLLKTGTTIADGFPKGFKRDLHKMVTAPNSGGEVYSPQPNATPMPSKQTGVYPPLPKYDEVVDEPKKAL